MEDEAPFLIVTEVAATTANAAATIFDDATTLLHQQICEKAGTKHRVATKKFKESAEQEFDNKLPCVQLEQLANLWTLMR
jgi:hypothetical protein